MSSLLHHIPNNPKFNEDIRKYIIEFESRIKVLDFFKAAVTKSELPPKDSSQFFSECIQAMEEAFAANINSYSAMRWIYYLRRTPNAVFSGELRSTGANFRALAEIYAQQSKENEDASFGQNGFVFRVDDSTLRHIARFMAFVIIVYDLQVGYRYANKGCSYVFASRDTQKMAAGLAPVAKQSVLPQRIPNDTIESAVRIYDERQDGPTTFIDAALQRAGLADHTDVSKDNWATSPVKLSFWGLQDESWFAPQKFLEGHEYEAKFGESGQFLVRFGPTHLDLERLFELHRLPSMAKVGIDESASLCLIVLLIGGLMLQSRRFSIVRVFEVGYFIVTPQEWEAFGEEQYALVCDQIRQSLPQFWAPETFPTFSSNCVNLKGSVWPITHGNPARFTRDYVCIDMWAASMGFLTAFQFPKLQGQIANDRAIRFEDVVQDLIDGTPWVVDGLRTVRQKTLCIDGKAVTDIDAIGTRGGDLLLVSCKSIPYTLEYDRGSHNAIRNAKSTVDEAVGYWAGIVQRFDENRKGDNYDFTTFERIIGVVCTPFAVYTTDAKALSVTAGMLRWASSVDELARFLRA
jgi:hypothetical protein